MNPSIKARKKMSELMSEAARKAPASSREKYSVS